MKFLKPKGDYQLSFVKMKAKADKKGNRSLILQFALGLNGAMARGLPQFLFDAWEAIRPAGSDIQRIELDHAVESQNVNLYRLPEQISAASADIRLDAVPLEKLTLEAQDDGTIFLLFSVTVPWAAAVWEWVGQTYGTEVWANFSEAQQELPLEKPAQNAQARESDVASRYRTPVTGSIPEKKAAKVAVAGKQS